MGKRCKLDAQIIGKQYYKVDPMSRAGCLRRSWKTVSLSMILGLFFFGWLTIVIFQLTGKYLCDTIFVNMGDDFVAALGTFNGLYDMVSPGVYVPFQERRVQYLERRSTETVSSGRGMFGYCNDLSAWTFRWVFEDEEYDPCAWVAKSPETDTFNILETVGDPWLVRDATSREVVLDPLRLICFDCENEGEENSDECGGGGTCSNAVCECEQGWYGLRCEFTTPCSALAIDARTDDFASTRDWASDFETVELENGELVEAYHRPVYIHEYDNGEYDAVMFTGRRWALTASDFLPHGGKVSDDELGELGGGAFPAVGDEIGNFFKYVFHGYKGYFDDLSVAFLSDNMDATTYQDSSSPVGFLWYRAEAAERTPDGENQAFGKQVDAEFLCRVCDGDANPCLYDGICNEGECQCSTDSFGKLCEVPPVKNGHCDTFFNTPQFKYDGGDCCENSCVSTPEYFCGAEEKGYVSRGYYSCHLPSEQWQHYSLDGDAGSYSGFAVDLAMRSLVVSELLQGKSV